MLKEMQREKGNEKKANVMERCNMQMLLTIIENSNLPP
jgi:hypothetical protein